MSCFLKLVLFFSTDANLGFWAGELTKRKWLMDLKQRFAYVKELHFKKKLKICYHYYNRFE